MDGHPRCQTNQKYFHEERPVNRISVDVVIQEQDAH